MKNSFKFYESKWEINYSNLAKSIDMYALMHIKQNVNNRN